MIMSSTTAAALTAALPPKTPISYLQELCARKGLTPKYDLMSIEGAVHEPTFIYRVTVGDITATGTGQSKKKAKHTAAKSVLEALLSVQLHSNSSTSTSSCSSSSSSAALVHQQQQQQHTSSIPSSSSPSANNEDSDEKVSSVLSAYDDGIPGNPVGMLQELCMSRRWPPPTYEVVEEHGLPHERMFTMACIVKKYVEKGVGKSKKLAKRQTAYNMLQQLKEVPGVVVVGGGGRNEASNVLDDEEDDERLGPPSKDSKALSHILSFAQRINQFYQKLRTSHGHSLVVLHSTMTPLSTLDCVQLLRDIGGEHDFDVTFVDIEEISRSGKFQCLVQLSTMPVAVCHGTGRSVEEAQVNAAENALLYLRIMTRD